MSGAPARGRGALQRDGVQQPAHHAELCDTRTTRTTTTTRPEETIPDQTRRTATEGAHNRESDIMMESSPQRVPLIEEYINAGVKVHDGSQQGRYATSQREGRFFVISSHGSHSARHDYTTLHHARLPKAKRPCGAFVQRATEPITGVVKTAGVPCMS